MIIRFDWLLDTGFVSNHHSLMTRQLLIIESSHNIEYLEVNGRENFVFLKSEYIERETKFKRLL